MDGYVLVAHPSTRTNLAGVFACGDLVNGALASCICLDALWGTHVEKGFEVPVSKRSGGRVLMTASVCRKREAR